MKWALAQGLIGSARESLMPVATGEGPNTYLGRNDFWKMMGMAFIAHALAIGVASILPQEKVAHIPVRALSFKLGDQDRIAAFGSPSGVGAPPVMTQPVVAAPVMNATRYEEVRPEPVEPIPSATAQPMVRWKPTPPRPKQPASAAPIVPPQHMPAIAPAPQQYVREVGQPVQAPAAGYGAPDGAVGGVGTQNTQTDQTVQAIRERYEQQISSWIERHKFYPSEAGGREGRVVVRMRIDRAGAVRYYAIEESSRIPSIDVAAIDMVRRANPVPAVPANYPAGNLIEFLIPITFRAPQ